MSGFLRAAETHPRHHQAEESVFFNEFQELVSKADPVGETGGKSVVTALEGRRVLAESWGEAEGLAPWFWGCFSSCSELQCFEC